MLRYRYGVWTYREAWEEAYYEFTIDKLYVSSLIIFVTIPKTSHSLAQ